MLDRGAAWQRAKIAGEVHSAAQCQRLHYGHHVGGRRCTGIRKIKVGIWKVKGALKQRSRRALDVCRIRVCGILIKQNSCPRPSGRSNERQTTRAARNVIDIDRASGRSDVNRDARARDSAGAINRQTDARDDVRA